MESSAYPGTFFSIGLADYFSDCLGFHATHNPPALSSASKLLFFTQRKKEPSSNCYLAMTADSSGTVPQEIIKKIMSGLFNINLLSTLLHVFNSYKEAQQFALDILTKERLNPNHENAYWIFTLKGTAHELNPLLNYRDFNGKVQHYPLDVRGHGGKIESRISKVQNNTNTIIFEKSSDSLLKKRIYTYFQETIPTDKMASGASAPTFST